MSLRTILLVQILTVILPWTQASISQHPDLYGKPCAKEPDADSTLARCDLNKNMYCSDKGICECIVGENGRIFSHHHKKCIEVASAENNFACVDDVQCKLSSYGRYSRCNMDYDQCKCHDEMEKTVLVDNICFIHRPPQRLGRSAQGLQGCDSDTDCQNSSLGNLSRCNRDQFTCECYDTQSSGKLTTAFYNGKCLFSKSLHEFCKEDDECRAGYHKNAVCENHPSYLPAEKVCQCPEGKRCDGSGAGANQVEIKSMLVIGLSTTIMGLLATKVFS